MLTPRSKCLFLFSVLLAPTICSAYDVRSGLVHRISVNAPALSNRNVIVELEGVSQMCTLASSAESGYINKADTPDTFAVLMSTLFIAQATGRAVTVFTVPGAEGCRIDQIQLAN